MERKIEFALSNRNDLRNQYPIRILGSRGKIGVYDKQPLPCNDHSDQNLYLLDRKTSIDLLFNLYKPLGHILICKAKTYSHKCNHFLRKHMIFQIVYQTVHNETTGWETGIIHVRHMTFF